VFACTLLTFALCADPKVPAALTFGDLTVPIVWSSAAMRSCMDLGATRTPADAQLETVMSIAGGDRASENYAGRVVLKLQSAKIEMTAFTWPKMSARERKQIRAIYRATLWHELGHLVTARASIAAENARADNLVTADSRGDFVGQMQAHRDAAFERFNADQTSYDAATEHGIRQDAAPPPLNGADTVAQCDAG